MFAPYKLASRPDGSAGSDQAVATTQTQAEPWSCAGLIDVAATTFTFFGQQPMNAAQPERKLAQFNGGGVKVDAIDVVGRDVMFDSAEFVGVLAGFNCGRCVRVFGVLFVCVFRITVLRG